VYVSAVWLVCTCVIHGATANLEQDNTEDEEYIDITPAPPISSTTPFPPSSSTGSTGDGAPPLPLCPPKPAVEEKTGLSNVLLVSTLDGQLSALDLSKDGEMLWSVSMHPGTLLDSTISNMDLDNRGYFVKLIPSLTGRLYKFDGEVVEQIPMDVDTLLGSSQKMQENIVITGGKETRTYGIDAKTGEVLYECSMNECNKFKEDSVDDMFVVQCSTKTVRAHAPKTGEQKWNFSVSLHDVSFYPGNDPCDKNDTEGDKKENEGEALIDDNIKTVVPEGIVCATRDDSTLKWKRKFQAPIVDVWQLTGSNLLKVNLFSKNHIPRRDVLLDDSIADENPSLYIGKHNNQLYIQESINILMGSMLAEDSDGSIKDVDFPRVSWKPYMVTPSRTPIINNGPVDFSNMISNNYDPVMHREDSKVTALSLTSGNAEYPYDSGFYLYTENTPQLNPEDPIANITGLLEGQINKKEEEEETTVELIYMSLWHWWKEVLMIAVVTAIMTNLLITGPIVHNLRDDFQEWSRQLVTHVENLQRERNAQEIVREVFVEVPVPSLTNNSGSTPSSATTIVGSSGPDFSDYMRQGSQYQSRFQSDFEPVQCLGKGGFGIVFECKNKYDDVYYAVKRITLPSSEESKKKVMREVKLHAKLDHKHIVRFYTTWMENPPQGWQKEADSWFNEEDLGSAAGPTNLDPTETEYSTQSKDLAVAHHKNPFYQYSISSQGSTDAFQRSSPQKLPKSSQKYSQQIDNEDSFSVRFEYSNCDSNNYNNNQDITSDTDSFSNNINCDNSESKSRIKNDQVSFGGFSTLDESGFSANYNYDDTTSGGIHFHATSSPLTEGISEVNGRKEAVSLDLDMSEDANEGSVNSDCCDALVWDSKELKEKKNTTVETRSYLYIVMQLCRKETLRDWLRNTTLRNQSEILGFFYQICVGVEYVHRQGLIHRDLKPSNIYFSHDGVVKIGDFGLVTGGSLPHEQVAPGFSGDQTDSRIDMYDQLTDQVGTQTYMSPEQLAQQSYNHKVDIYSLGLIFLELCVCFSTQMERVQTLTAAKKHIYPEVINSDPNLKLLLSSMLNRSAELRPEAESILELDWLQNYKHESTKRRRLESNSFDSPKLA